MTLRIAPRVTIAPACPYVDAYAEWDDPHAFRVFLVLGDQHPGLDPIDCDDEDCLCCHESVAMPAFGGTDDGTIESRLYRAAFVACPKDIAKLTVDRRALDFATKPPAERVARAVKKELAAIAAGKPGPTDFAIQVALLRVPRKGRR